MDARLEPLLERTPDWLSGEGPESEVVVASRVRLARNLSATPFPLQMEEQKAREMLSECKKHLKAIIADGVVLEPAELGPADAEFLIERSLASRDLFEAQRPALVFFREDGRNGLMVNEEDHFRGQGFASGLDLEIAYKHCQEIIHPLETSFPVATHPKFGYLTACPTNVGSGMRASLLLHLPALARKKAPLQHILHTAQKSGLTVRGVHGEGSRDLGHLYQISNQKTLGGDSSMQLKSVEEFGGQVVAYENGTREEIFETEPSRRGLLRDVEQAYTRLQESTRITTSQALGALSILRLASLGGLLGQSGIDFTAEQLLIQSFSLQPGHLQARIGAEMDPVHRDSYRATLLRESLGIAGP